ncbi:acetyl-CoA carboxylase biotin carboxylase subunit [Jeotgalibacillus terrae]|uniref:biotin carboxylase n=1 Tax=Jeotgalibacillus terrae TaxID=587735 RepID=A0ABW5ZDZ6_9BACL|nr:biotin carboxylase N-terminal domain-containing protein [Jeotgalibacillus terrae]MBM7578399.1 acetyl-CoA carboxylase biotin carboxylase subunit [Jeotgalibacillus terrae]
MRKILIANRGEIALRIIKTCRRMDIETVAVYSDADKDLPYVQAADTALHVGPPPVAQSYLHIERLLEIAAIEKVDAIHPGYGLLSENADFAERIEKEGYIFIGPSSSVLRKMGDKIEARKTVAEAGVPVVPGYESESMTLEDACREAGRIGYPVMLKASSGGGGVGMVLCDNEQALTQHFEPTIKRSQTYFGSGKLFIEKYIPKARHIEVQIFGNAEGKVFHLFERNCSIQRRNQKVIEESPSPSLTQPAKDKLYELAVRAAEAVNYKNAGTIECILDADENPYFLEMNTRLQVEHPVTEEVTGIDLVEWQILTAFNEKIPVLSQEDIQQQGHSIEFRIYAEDPKTFYPSPGTLEKLEFPEGEGIRVDEGYRESNKVTPYYDPMIAKFIVTADSRQSCISQARQAIDSIKVEGVKTNIPVHKAVLDSAEFMDGKYHTQTLTKIKGE